jgi:hypothetical protein
MPLGVSAPEKAGDLIQPGGITGGAGGFVELFG